MTIKDMRLKIGYSQSELAQLAGINLRSLQDYEQGHKPIACAKGETLYRLSQTLGVSMEAILADSCATIELCNNHEERLANRIMAYEKALNRRRESVVHFPKIVEDKLVDMSRIYPTKQKPVKRVIEELRGDVRIDSVWLFGSSITMRCHKDSDLDFAVALTDSSEPVKNEISEKIQLGCDWSADIIWLDRIKPSERIYQDIQKGVLIV